MKFFKITLLVGLALETCHVQAQNYPSKPITFVVPFSAGGNADIAARILAKQMSSGLGQPIVVENKAGANGSIGLDAVRRALPDGYTLLVSPSSPLVVNPAIYRNLPYQTLRDFEPISLILTYQYALVVRNDSPIRSIDDLKTMAKNSPGTLSYGSSGVGGGGHLAGELLALKIGSPLNHIPYKGTAPALADLIGGQLTFTFDTVMTATQQVKEKRLRALAVSGVRRAESLPEIPTMQQLGFEDFNVMQFIGLLAPVKTSKLIVERLNQEAVKAMRSPEVLKALGAAAGNDIVASSAQEFKAQLERDMVFYSKLTQAANIKAD